MKRIPPLAPSYFEFNSGAPAVQPAVLEKDSIEFTDETMRVQTIDISTLTPEQREAYERAFK